MSYKKFNSFGFNFDDLGKVVEDFMSNTGINDVFGQDYIKTTPAINVSEHPEHMELEVAAPGMKKEDFELHIEDNLLVIESSRKVKETKEDVKIRRKEFGYSTFKRTFRLDNEFDTQRISASYEQGILLITIPKKTAEQSSKIKVEIK